MRDYAEIFSKNLREMRRASKLTQKALGDMLGYSEKAISKWESGGAMPPSAVLPEIARFLHTSIDSLLTEATEALYYLGIDGGGTKTEFLLTDAKGRELSRTVLGGSNPTDIGIDKTCEILREGIVRTVGEYPMNRVSVFAGIAGGITGDNKAAIKAFLDTYRFAKADNGSDAQNAVSAGLGSDDGIAVILGTGSVAFTKSKGRLSRFGGFGHLIGDEGSGFAIGRDGILAALKSEDGSGDKTYLEELVRGECGGGLILEKLSVFYSGGKRKIASFAPLVFDAYRAQDAVAERILRQNMKEVASLINAASKVYESDSKIPVVLCGGLSKCHEILLPMIEENLKNNRYSLSICRRPIVRGALLLAGLLED